MSSHSKTDSTVPYHEPMKTILSYMEECYGRYQGAARRSP